MIAFKNDLYWHTDSYVCIRTYIHAASCSKEINFIGWPVDFLDQLEQKHRLHVSEAELLKFVRTTLHRFLGASCETCNSLLVFGTRSEVRKGTSKKLNWVDGCRGAWLCSAPWDCLIEKQEFNTDTRICLSNCLVLMFQCYRLQWI